jgi:hypothetical protein
MQAMLRERHPDVVALGRPTSTQFEVVNMVVDANQGHGRRVDIFIYMDTGYIVRVHPGHHGNGSNDMRPIVIPPRSPLLRNVDMAHGAGWAMHRAPPSFVRQENEAALGKASAATRGQASATGEAVCPRPGRPSSPRTVPSLLGADDAAIIPSCDVSTAGNDALEDVFPPGDDIEADVSLDARVPWWLWLSGGATRSQCTAAPGIVGAHAGRLQGYPFVKVNFPDGTSRTATWERGTKPAWSRPSCG